MDKVRIPVRDWSPEYKFAIQLLRREGILKYYYINRNRYLKRRDALSTQERILNMLHKTSQNVINDSFTWSSATIGSVHWGDVHFKYTKELQDFKIKSKVIEEVTW